MHIKLGHRNAGITQRIGSEIGILLIVISSIGMTVACTSTSPPETESVSVTKSLEERSAYNEVPLPPVPQRLGGDPEQIAVDAFGIVEPVEGNFSQEVVLVDQSPSQAIVTLTQTGLLDDSVEGMRFRLEFVTEENQWELVWVGSQVRCYPDRGSQRWTTDLCS